MSAAPYDAINSREETGAQADIVTEVSRDAPGIPRHTRRLPDKVLVAFHHACDTTDLVVADQLLRVLEVMVTRRPATGDGNRRRSMESLVAAHERLWHLRHPEPLD